eukprot:3021876-Amphidinium_carterae.1
MDGSCDDTDVLRAAHVLNFSVTTALGHRHWRVKVTIDSIWYAQGDDALMERCETVRLKLNICFPSLSAL